MYKPKRMEKISLDQLPDGIFHLSAFRDIVGEHFESAFIQIHNFVEIIDGEECDLTAINLCWPRPETAQEQHTRETRECLDRKVSAVFKYKREIHKLQNSIEELLAFIQMAKDSIVALSDNPSPSNNLQIKNARGRIKRREAVLLKKQIKLQTIEKMIADFCPVV